MRSQVLFLRCFLSRDRFQDALAWIKSQESRVFLPESKLWAYDPQTTEDDPAWEFVLSEIEEEGWRVVGETAWEPDRPLKSNIAVLEGLAALSVEGIARPQNRTGRKQSK